MNKLLKIIITGIFCLLIIGVGTFIVLSDDSTGDRMSKDFIKSITYIQDENYIEAYNNIKNGNEDEIEIIQTIIFYIFSDEFKKSSEIVLKLSEETGHITDYLRYTYLYSKDDKYQQNIDKIYDDEYSKLYTIKDKITKDIMFDDTLSFYDVYFEYLDLANGLFRNYEYNIINDGDNLVNRIGNVSSKLNELTSEYEVACGKHPIDSVPEEYRILLNLSK